MKMDLSNLYAAADAGDVDLNELIAALQAKQAEITKAAELKLKKAAEEKRKNREKAMHGIVGYIFLAYPKVPREEAEKMADAALAGIDEISENYDRIVSFTRQLEKVQSGKADDETLCEFLKTLGA